MDVFASLFSLLYAYSFGSWQPSSIILIRFSNATASTRDIGNRGCETRIHMVSTWRSTLYAKYAAINRSQISIRHRRQRRETPYSALESRKSLVEFAACCGLGHRLARMTTTAAHVSVQLSAGLHGFWKCCGTIVVFTHLALLATLDSLFKSTAGITSIRATLSATTSKSVPGCLEDKARVSPKMKWADRPCTYGPNELIGHPISYGPNLIIDRSVVRYYPLQGRGPVSKQVG
jgi:hypothetical protein